MNGTYDPVENPPVVPPAAALNPLIIRRITMIGREQSQVFALTRTLLWNHLWFLFIHKTHEKINYVYCSCWLIRSYPMSHYETNDEWLFQEWIVLQHTLPCRKSTKLRRCPWRCALNFMVVRYACTEIMRQWHTCCRFDVGEVEISSSCWCTCWPWSSCAASSSTSKVDSTTRFRETIAGCSS